MQEWQKVDQATKRAGEIHCLKTFFQKEYDTRGKLDLHKEMKKGWVPVVHTNNPSYLGD
jgi:hypothetical protein